MFIASDNELREFTCKLLQTNFACQAVKALEEEDENQIRYMKLSMVEKMPKELCSSKYSVDIALKGVTKMENDCFPSMHNPTNKKNYQYIDDDLQNIKRIAQKYAKTSQVKPQPSKNEEQTPKDVQIKQNLVQMKEGQVKEKGDLVEENYQKVKDQTTPISQQRQRQKSSKKGSSRPQSQHQSKHSVGSGTELKRFSTQPPQPTRVNPFIKNNLNFTDHNANSKTLQGKYSHLTLSENSRNITAIVQTSKFNAFSNSTSFPTSVMPGTILTPKETSFSKQAKLDVNDVMRYTLGVSKMNNSRQKMENPFNRPPKKRIQ